MKNTLLLFVVAASMACGDAGDDTSGDGASTPKLTCDPTASGPNIRCPCMANIVCDQMYYCLSDTMIQSAPNAAYAHPQSTCVSELQSDCEADASDSGYEPTDYSACLRGLESSTCAEFGDFNSVSEDFPASCDNLRALDTGLGIAL